MEKERVAEIRQTLKQEFPDIKFSVSKEAWRGIHINVMKAPSKYGFQDYNQKPVNEYHLESQFADHEDAKSVMIKIRDIANTLLGVTYRETGDYGYQPNYYVWLGIGKWDKEFQIIDN
jgi:hypothetical protein